MSRKLLKYIITKNLSSQQRAKKVNPKI